MSKFAVVSDESIEMWAKIHFPVMSTETYDLSNTSYYISVGLFNYDTTNL